MKAFSKTLTAILLTISRMSALIIVLALSAILARLLDKPQYGAFRQILMLYAVFSVIFQVGIPQSIFYFLPRLREEEKRGFVIQSLAMLFLQGVVLSVGLYVGADHLGRILNSEYLAELLRAFAPYPALMIPVMAAESTLMSYQRVKSIVFMNVFIKMVMFFSVIVPIWLGYTLVFALQCWVTVALLQLMVAMGLILRPLPRGALWNGSAHLKSQYRYSLPIAVASLLGTGALYADKFVVSMLGGDAIFAVYANGAFEIPLIAVLASSVTVAIMPTMVEHVKEGRYDEFVGLWRRVQGKQALVVFPIFGFFYFFARESVLVLFGDAYRESVAVFKVYLLLTPLRICIFASVLLPLNKNWVYAAGHLIQLSLCAVLSLVLYQAYGLTGAALGAVIATGANVMYQGQAFLKIIQRPATVIWPARRLLVILGLATGCGFLAHVLVWFIPAEGLGYQLLGLGMGSILFMFLYYLALRYSGLLEDIRQIFRRVSVSRINQQEEAMCEM